MIGGYGQYTVFWQIDTKYKVRTAKLIEYNPDTLKRRGRITWVHRITNPQGFNLEQCLFGLHLVNIYPNLPIGIVESEKTALLMRIHLPHTLWMACGSLTNFSEKMLSPLKHKRIIAYPDCSPNNTAYNHWYQKATELNKQGFSIRISRILEDNTTLLQKEKGYDLADLLLKAS